MLVLNRSDVRELLDERRCIDAVENTLRRSAVEGGLVQGALGTHVEAGGFHVKAAALGASPGYYAAKVNANFPDNPASRNLPTVQGVLVLFNAVDGAPLALMDSIEITILRTAAASAIAAKYLSAADARVLSIIGCGVQGRGHLMALFCVRSFERVVVYDPHPGRAEAFARQLSETVGVDIESAPSAAEAARAGDVVVTCTPGRRQVLATGDLRRGSFLAAVGADNESKRELDPQLLVQSAVVVDSLEQCATIGELHHALAAGIMSVDEVRADLAQVVAGIRRGRMSDSEVVIFDSTGTALQDLAAATVVYESAVAGGRGRTIALDD